MCLDLSRGGVACIDDAPCPSAGVCAQAASRPGEKATASCCLFPDVCVGGRQCCARSRVCGTKCCPEGYACLAGACAPSGCLGLKEGVALAAAVGGGRGGSPAAKPPASSPTTAAFTALVPTPTLPKGLELQYADEALASRGAQADPFRLAQARPYVRVESPGACCALCGAVPRCTSFTHGAVVLSASGGDGYGQAVRSSCELWAEGPAAAEAVMAAAASSSVSKGAPANGESATRPAAAAARAQQLQSVPAPAWVTSGRVPRRATEDGSKTKEEGDAASAAALSPGARVATATASGDNRPIMLSAASPSRWTPVGGGLYGGAFDTHVGDYQGTAIKAEEGAATAERPTPCSRASDAVKAGGDGTAALFNALHGAVAGLPSAYEAVMTEEEYLEAAQDLLGPSYANKKALDERWWGDVGGVGSSGGGGARPATAASGGGGKGGKADDASDATGNRRRRLAQQQPAAAPPDPCGASLALMTSTWLAGGTVLNGGGGGGDGGAPSGTVRACCELCAATGGCQYWTFSTPLATCWLRSGSGAALAFGGGAAAPASLSSAAASQPGGSSGPLSSVPCRYSISGAMQGAPSPGLCPAALVCRGAATEALPDGAASCCPAAGWVCGAAGVCCPPGSMPCGQQCACPAGTACNSGGPTAQCVVVAAPAAVAVPPTAAAALVAPPMPTQQQQQLAFGPTLSPSGNVVNYSADTPRFGYFGRGVTDGAALVTDPSDPQACRNRPSEGAAAFRFGRIVALNSGGALNRNAPVAQATAVDCCLACGGIGNCDAFSWDAQSLACRFWTNKINGVAQQRLETAQQGAVTGDMIRALTFRSDGIPEPRLDDACRAPCGPSDGSRPALCCQDGRETCLAPTGVGAGGDRHSCCGNASVCGRRCGCDPGSLCVSGETCCPGERVCGGVCCPQGQACNQNGACATPQDRGGLVVLNPQPYWGGGGSGWGWNSGAWNTWNGGGWSGNVVMPLPVSRGNVFEG
jgi:hypothetical protein